MVVGATLAAPKTVFWMKANTVDKVTCEYIEHTCILIRCISLVPLPLFSSGNVCYNGNARADEVSDNRVVVAVSHRPICLRISRIVRNVNWLPRPPRTSPEVITK